MKKIRQRRRSKKISVEDFWAHTNVNIPQRSQPFPELLHLRRIRLNLLALLILIAALLLRMKPQILQQNHLPAAGLINRPLDLRADAVLRENHRAATKQLLQLGHDGLQAEFGIGLAVWPAEMGHEHDGFGAVVDGIFDGWKRSDDSLVVCDVLVLVEGDIEVDLCLYEGCKLLVSII